MRARNILRKLGSRPLAANAPAGYGWSPVEAALAQTISAFPAVTKSAAISYSPHALCDYLLKLSADFSAFYEAKKVIEAESEDALQARGLLVCLETGMLDNAELAKSPTATAVRDILNTYRGYHFHDTSPTAPSRQHCYVDNNRPLRSDAGNLAASVPTEVAKRRNRLQTHRQHHSDNCPVL